MALVVMTDVAFLAQPLDARTYLALHRPCTRDAVGVRRGGYHICMG